MCEPWRAQLITELSLGSLRKRGEIDLLDTFIELRARERKVHAGFELSLI